MQKLRSYFESVVWRKYIAKYPSHDSDNLYIHA